ncbi:hypothetical protein ABIB66_000001, partial [Bradyrhizobium sp. F1.13.3]
APTRRALPANPAARRGQNWTPMRGQICKPIDNLTQLLMPATTPRPPSSEQVAAFDRNASSRSIGISGRNPRNPQQPKDRGIRVNIITPGPTDTPLIDAQVSSPEEAAAVRATCGEHSLGAHGSSRRDCRCDAFFLVRRQQLRSGIRIASRRRNVLRLRSYVVCCSEGPLPDAGEAIGRRSR